jgi:hypothetical protein
MEGTKTMGEPVVLTSGPFKGQEGILRRVDETVAEVETLSGITLKVSPEEVWIGEAPPMETWVGKPQGKPKPKEGKKEKGGKEKEPLQPEIQKVRAEENQQRAEADRELRRLFSTGLLEIRDVPQCALCGTQFSGKSREIVEGYRKHKCFAVQQGRKIYYRWRNTRIISKFLERVPPKAVIVGAKPLRTYWRVVLASLGAHGKVSVCGGNFPKVKALAELMGKAVGATVRVQLDGTVEVEE